MHRVVITEALCHDGRHQLVGVTQEAELLGRPCRRPVALFALQTCHARAPGAYALRRAAFGVQHDHRWRYCTVHQ